MAKYSYEFKKKIIKAYLSGEGSYSYLARKYGIPDKHMVNLWINNYKAFGDDALMCSRNIKKYTFKKNLAVVELYLSNEISYRDLAIQEYITNPCMIINWVKRFHTDGPDALRPQKKGRKKSKIG